MRRILLALILGVGIQAVAQQQQWGADNCLWTSTGYRSWAQTDVCRIVERGNPNAFVIYGKRDPARTPIMRVDLSKAATTGWIYAYNYAQRSNFRYVNRGVWNPSANPADYQFYIHGAWVAPPPSAAVAAAPQPAAPMRGAPTMSPEAKASNDAAAALMTGMQMHGLIQSLGGSNARDATPKPVCGVTTPDGVPCYSRY